MPFKSQAQRRLMYAKHPDIAKRWEAHTPSGAKLSERKSAPSKRPASKSMRSR